MEQQGIDWTRYKTAWLIYILCWLSLGIVGMSREPALIRASDSVWLPLSFVLLCAPWLLAIAQAHRERRRPLAIPVSGTGDRTPMPRSGNPFVNSNLSDWKWLKRTLALLIAIFAVTYFAAFSGIAKLLHYAERRPGTATVTIAAKHVSYDKYRPCIPRLAITGRVSRYAIEPDRLEVSSASAVSGT